MAAPGSASRRRLLILTALAALTLAVALVGLVLSRAPASTASYTTASDTQVTATAASAAGWFSLYSRDTDPDPADRPGYALQNDVTPATPCASGQDNTLVVNWGLVPDANARYTFTQAFTLETAPTFPVPGVTSATIGVATTTPAGESDVVWGVDIAPIGQGGGNSSITIGTATKCQVDVTLRIKKQMGTSGDQFHPSVVLTLTYSGGPPSYYVVTIPTVVTIK